MGTREAGGRIDAARATIALTVRQRCFYLFCALVLLIVAVPLYEETRAGRIALNIMNLLILLSGASAIGRGGGAFVISLLLAAPAGIFQVLGYAVEDHRYVILSEAFAAGFYFITVTYLLLYALRREVLTMDKLYGAAAGYLMMGVMWAYFYSLLLWIHPGALTINGTARKRRCKLDRHRDYILGLITATPDLTISELLALLLAERSVHAARAIR